MNKRSSKEIAQILPLQPSDRQACTEKLYLFLRRHFSIFDLFFFSVHLASSADHVRQIAATALAKTDSDNPKAMEGAEKDKDSIFKKLQSFGGLQSENLCIRLTDNFVCYISEIIQVCMLQRPELLRSGEMVKIEDVLKFSRYDDLVSFLVDKKLNELTYGGIKEISTFLTERTGFDLFKDENERALLSVGVELRNIYTHNRGVVNELFLKRTASSREALPGWEFVQGERFHANFGVVTALANNMYRIANRIDEQAAKKFRLKKKSYGKWKRDKEKLTTQARDPSEG